MIDKIKTYLILIWLILKESIKSFRNNDNFQNAATLAYYGFFSIIPLFLLVIILLSRLTITSDYVYGEIDNLTAKLLPEFNEIILKEIYTLAQQKIWGAFSIIALLWIITPFSSSIRKFFSRVFKAESQANIIKAKLLNLTASLALLSLFIFIVVGKILYTTIADSNIVNLPFLQDRMFIIIIQLFTSVIFISFFYNVFCPLRLNFLHTITGSLVTGILLFSIRPVFGLFLKFNPNYGYAFGSLKAMFILTVWIFYSFMIILFGAELMSNMRRKEALLLKGLFVKSPTVSRYKNILLNRFIEFYEPEEMIIEEGSTQKDMFYILSGSVKVKKNEITVTVLNDGDYFGEMSLLLEEPRTATITVSSPDTQIVRISEDNFDTIIRENPEIVKSILKEMASRLKVTTKEM